MLAVRRELSPGPRAQGVDTFVGVVQERGPYFDVTLSRTGQPYAPEGYLTDVFTNEAIDFVESSDDLPERTAKIYGMMARSTRPCGRSWTASVH